MRRLMMRIIKPQTKEKRKAKGTHLPSADRQRTFYTREYLHTIGLEVEGLPSMVPVILLGPNEWGYSQFLIDYNAIKEGITYST